jgi:rhomboid protease GluP
MAFGGRLATQALEAFIGLLDSLGFKGARWEWRKQAWRQSLEQRLARWENVERAVRTTTRMCRACRALVEGGASHCTVCGASMRGVPRGGVSRVLSLVAPGVPTVSTLIVSANVGMSILALLIGGMEPGAGLFRLLSPPGETLFLLGSKWTPAILVGEAWRLVTANYLHGGLLHLLFNSYALMTLGPLIEEAFGARRLFVLYTLCGISGFVASAIMSPHVQSIGASAAIFGLLGFAIVFGRFRSGPAGRYIADQLTRWLLYGLVMFFIPGIDNYAHIGGLVPGAVLGLILDPGPPRSRARDIAVWLFFAAALLVTAASFAAMALSYDANLKAISG